MSRNKLSLRLHGDLLPAEELTKLLGFSPTVDRRRGMPTRSGTSDVQEVDVWALDLARWEGIRADSQVMAQATAVLEHMVPALAALDRSRCQAKLYLSTIRDEEWSGIDIPSDIIVAAGAAKLDMIISVLVMWPEDEDDESEE